MRPAILVCLALAAVHPLWADVQVVRDLRYGWPAMPPTLHFGPWELRSFPDDTRPTGYAPVPFIPAQPPLWGPLIPDQQLYHLQVGWDWAYWALSRKPDVYWTYMSDLMLTLPPETSAIAFWMSESMEYHMMMVTVTDSEGGQGSFAQTHHWYDGALGYGFYTTDGTALTTVTIKAYDRVDIAVGEFYGARLPEPTTAVLLGLAALVSVRRRR